MDYLFTLTLDDLPPGGFTEPSGSLSLLSGGARQVHSRKYGGTGGAGAPPGAPGAEAGTLLEPLS